MATQTPIGFLIFNRPDTTQRVFRAIARAQPRKLFVVCDAARPKNAGEEERVTASREIINSVDWPCEVLTNYATENMGCKDRITSGLEWIFGQVEEAIILEDDCLPEPSFFPFCENLLDHYRDDKRVVSISGNNFQQGNSRTHDSYYFSKYFHCWGWATWRRVWNNFDPNMSQWSDFSAAEYFSAFADSSEEESYWRKIFSAQHAGQIDSWAYPWLFSCWAQNGLTAIPDVNLVSNIGFREDATHTTGDSHLANLQTRPIGQIRHPRFMARHKVADEFSFAKIYKRMHRLQRIKLKIRKRIFRKKNAAA